MDIFRNVIIGPDSYVEFHYGNKNIGVFGESLIKSRDHIGSTITFELFLRSLMSIKIYNSTENDIKDAANFYNIPQFLFQRQQLSLEALKNHITTNVDIFIKDLSDSVVSQYLIARIIPLVNEAKSSDDESLIYDRLYLIHNYLTFLMMMADFFNSQDTNYIFYVHSIQFGEVLYFFRNILHSEPVLQIPTGRHFSFNGINNSFLFKLGVDQSRLQFKDYTKMFIDTPSNCGPNRFIAGNNVYLLSFCDLIPLQDVQFIYGPISYAEYTDGIRNIAVFGENHDIPVPSFVVNKRNTLTVPSLLKTMLITFPTTFYDLFLESGYVSDKLHIKRTLGIVSFDHIFKSCLSVVKNCPFNNIRAHYTDYRTVLSDRRYKQISEKLHSPKSETDDFFLKENLIFEFITAIDTVTDIINTDPKLLRAHGTPIHKFIMERIEKEREMFLHWIDISKMERRIDLLYNIMSIFVLVMDMYTLIRVFKDFGTTNPSHPSIAKNAIIYAGEEHAINYKDFFEKSGFKLKFKFKTFRGYPLDFRMFKDQSFLFHPT